MERKTKLLQIRVDEAFLQKIEVIKRERHIKTTAEAVRWSIDRAFENATMPYIDSKSLTWAAFDAKSQKFVDTGIPVEKQGGRVK